MQEKEAKALEEKYRSVGWDVRATKNSSGWFVAASSADGGAPTLATDEKTLQTMALSGAMARIVLHRL